MPDLAQSPPQRRNVAWLWFAYCGFFLLVPVFEPSVFLWIVTLAGIAIFALIFSFYIRCDEDSTSPRRYYLIAATFLLGLALFPFNGGASTFFIYAAAFLPFVVDSVRTILLLFAAEWVVILTEAMLLHGQRHLPHTAIHFGINWPNTFIALFLILVVGGANIFFAEQKRFHVQQLQAARELQHAQEQNLALAAIAERERIARDLHDVLGHTLSVVTLKAELAQRLLATSADPTIARAAAEIADVERLARTSLTEVREAISGYRTRGLTAEIEAARRTLAAAGVSLALYSGGEPVPVSSPATDDVVPDATVHVSLDHAAGLSANEETVLALALREAVTNIVRHARATRCTLRFITERNLLRLSIEDDGSASKPPREGNGLRGMRQRIESVGGALALEHDHGTRLLITLPSQG